MISIRAIPLKKTDITSGPVKSNEDALTSYLIYLDSNKTASERFQVESLKHDILHADVGQLHLIWGRLKNRQLSDISTQQPVAQQTETPRNQ